MAEVVLPHNDEAEKAVLGAMLIDTEAAAVVLASLLEASFFNPKHQIVFRAGSQIALQRSVIDPTTMCRPFSYFSL